MRDWTASTFTRCCTSTTWYRQAASSQAGSKAAVYRGGRKIPVERSPGPEVAALVEGHRKIAAGAFSRVASAGDHQVAPFHRRKVAHRLALGEVHHRRAQMAGLVLAGEVDSLALPDLQTLRRHRHSGDEVDVFAPIVVVADLQRLEFSAHLDPRDVEREQFGHAAAERVVARASGGGQAQRSERNGGKAIPVH